MKLFSCKFSTAQILVFVILAGLIVFNLLMRMWFLGHDLPYYSIDENDIVEPALAFVSGDWDPRWYKYGPLYSYVLALIYTFQHWLLVTFFGWSTNDFFYSAFFDSTAFYYIARVVHFVIIIGATIVAARLCWKYYDKSTTYVLLILSSAPLIETITSFTVRIDSLQGFLALAALYISHNFNYTDKYYWSYIGSGAIVGLVIATKPLTGFLILPAILVAHLLSVPSDVRHSFATWLGYSFVKNRGLYIFCVTLVLIHSIVHPYSVINYAEFWMEQFHVIFNHSEQLGVIPGYNFLWLSNKWGPLLMLVAIASPLLLFLKKDKITIILVSYILTFVVAFLLFKVRTYWYLSIIPVLLVVMARFIVIMWSQLLLKYNSDHLKGSSALILLVIAFILTPTIELGFRAWDKMGYERSDISAQNWIEENIASGSRILTVGWYSSTLPRLISGDIDSHAGWAEHFMYHRNENEPWVDNYITAYRRMRNSSMPTYDLLNIRKHYQTNYGNQMLGEIPIDQLFERDLPALARQNRAQYIITGSPKYYSGSWENSEGVTLLAEFGRSTGYKGAQVKVFELN